MNTRLQHLFNSLEKDRAVLLHQIKNVSSEEFHFAPQGKWSVQQILAHLIAGERLSIQYLNKKILGIETTKNSGVLDELKMLALKASQRLPLKFKAPRKVVELTPHYHSIDDLDADWNQVRSELKILLEKFRDDQIRKRVYRHVRAGLMNIQHALLFFREHIIHHTPQINRLITHKD